MNSMKYNDLFLAFSDHGIDSGGFKQIFILLLKYLFAIYLLGHKGFHIILKV